MNETKKEATQAEKWLQTLRDRTANITGAEQLGEVVRIVKQVDADFPNQLFILVQDEKPIGTRRVFGDRSYAQSLDADSMRITFGVMSEGMLGAAGNGRTIMNPATG